MSNPMLKALGFNHYGDYLNSEHWHDVRKRFYNSRLVKRREGKICCEACMANDRKLDLHHKTYKRLGKERLNDLTLLCHDCHEAAHAMHRGNKRDGLWAATKRSKRKINPAMRSYGRKG